MDLSLVFLLDLSTGFESLQSLEHVIGIEQTALARFKSHLSDGFLLVHVKDEALARTKEGHGVPQGSVLKPLLFPPYMLQLATVDIQLHLYEAS